MLYHVAGVSQLIIEKDRVVGVMAEGMPEQGFAPTGRKLTVRARHTILAGGAINNPGILLRSKAVDPHERVGKRTMVHPVSASFAQFEREMNGWTGAPQSQYSDHFQWKDGADGPMGFKLEVLPMLPAFIAGLLGSFGETHLQEMKALGHLNGMIALLRDGFTEDSPGGSVSLRDDGSPVLDYPMTDSLADGLRRAYLAMAEMQFAAGAKQARMMQMGSPAFKSWAEAKSAIANFSIEKFRTGLGTAHLMGGCAMGEDPRISVVNSQGQHHQLESLSIMDGSVFPTSIGANPQLSIYGLVTRNATLLAQQLAPTTAARADEWAALRMLG